MSLFSFGTVNIKYLIPSGLNSRLSQNKALSKDWINLRTEELFINMYSQLSRLSTARGSCTGLVTVGPAKVKVCKSVLFTEGTPEV